MMDYELILRFILLVVFGAALVFAYPYLEARLGAEKLKAIWKEVCIAVSAAEQIFGSGEGKRKKEYAWDYLYANGVAKKAPEEQLDALIEAAVYELT